MASLFPRNYFDSPGQWLLLGASILAICLQFSETSVVVTPFCENSTVTSKEKGPKELLLAVKSNRPQMVMVLTSKGLNINMKTDSGDSLLHVSVMCGSNEVTRTLLKLGEDPNVQGHNGLTPIYRAAEINDVEAMKELYEKGADLQVRNAPLNDSLMHLVCQKGHVEAASWLFSIEEAADLATARNNRSVTPLHFCAQNGHFKLAKMMLEHGASLHARDIEGNTVLHYTARKGHLDVVKYLVENGANIDATSNVGNTPLHRASEFGHEHIVKFFLEKGASVNPMMNVFGVAPLHLAIFHLSTIKLLLDHGADVNIKTYSGETPLHWAASGVVSNQPRVLQELIDRGSDVNSQMRNGWTPLHISSLHGLNKNIETLLKNGASVNEKDSNGRVPLHFAAARGDVELLKLLLGRGARLDIKDADGETPVTWAENCGQSRFLEYLKSHRN